jgi:hypothetical protein
MDRLDGRGKTCGAAPASLEAGAWYRPEPERRMSAIYVVLIFLAVMAAFNKFEYGRFD